MKTIRALLAVLLLMGILSLSRPSVMTYEVGYARLTGTLLPVEERGLNGNRESLDVLINGKARIFQLAKVENLKAGGGSGGALLRQIFPARVNFVGADDLIHNLQEPKLIGKPLTIIGFLYPASRVLFITAVDGEQKIG